MIFVFMLGFGVRRQQMLNFISRAAQSIVQKAFRTITLLTSGFLRVILPNLNGHKKERRGVCACVCCVRVRVRGCEVSGGHSGTGCPCPGSSGASSTRAGRSSSWQTIALSIRPGNNHQFMEGKGGARGESGGGLVTKNAPWTEFFANKHTRADCVAIVGADLWNWKRTAVF